jgi:hypothetical protein
VFAGLLRAFVRNLPVVHQQLQPTLEDFDRVTVVVETATNVTCSKKDIELKRVLKRACAQQDTSSGELARVLSMTFGTSTSTIILDDSNSTNIMGRLQQVPWHTLQPADMVIALRPDVIFTDHSTLSRISASKPFVPPPLTRVCERNPGFNLISGNYNIAKKRGWLHDRDWDYGFVVCDRPSLVGFIAFVRHYFTRGDCRQLYPGCVPPRNEPPPRYGHFPHFGATQFFCDKSDLLSCALFAHIYPVRFGKLDREHIFLSRLCATRENWGCAPPAG